LRHYTKITNKRRTAKNDLYQRAQSKPRGLGAALAGLEERHTDGNGAHHTARRACNRYGILKGGDDMIIIKKCFSWYDVYIDNMMILHHISEQDKIDILKAAEKSGDKIKIA
jgi:uncharacterized FlgJ-related protein